MRAIQRLNGCKYLLSDYRHDPRVNLKNLMKSQDTVKTVNNVPLAKLLKNKQGRVSSKKYMKLYNRYCKLKQYNQMEKKFYVKKR